MQQPRTWRVFSHFPKLAFSRIGGEGSPILKIMHHTSWWGKKSGQDTLVELLKKADAVKEDCDQMGDLLR